MAILDDLRPRRTCILVSEGWVVGVVTAFHEVFPAALGTDAQLSAYKPPFPRATVSPTTSNHRRPGLFSFVSRPGEISLGPVHRRSQSLGRSRTSGLVRMRATENLVKRSCVSCTNVLANFTRCSHSASAILTNIQLENSRAPARRSARPVF